MTSTDDDAESGSRSPQSDSAASTSQAAPRKTDTTDFESAHAFFMAIEDAYLRLKGKAALLPPNNWQLAERWYQDGIPIGLIEQALEEVFVRRWQAGKEGISSLRYARPAVEKAWKAYQKLQAPGVTETAEEAVDSAGRLEALARALPADWTGRERWMESIRTLAEETEVETVEDRLAELDGAMLDDAWQSLEPALRGELEQRLEDSIEPLRARLPSDEIERAEKRLRHRLLRSSLGLPLLSLFAPEALAGADDSESR